MPGSSFVRGFITRPHPRSGGCVPGTAELVQWEHMNADTVKTLLDLNRTFYNDFAEAFSDSRGASEPGFERIVAKIRPGDRVLDLGCGQGRLAGLLPPSCTYTGVDNAGAMLRIAEQTTRRHQRDVCGRGPGHRSLGSTCCRAV